MEITFFENQQGLKLHMGTTSDCWISWRYCSVDRSNQCHQTRIPSPHITTVYYWQQCSGAGTRGNGIPTPFSRFVLKQVWSCFKLASFLGAFPHLYIPDYRHNNLLPFSLNSVKLTLFQTNYHFTPSTESTIIKKYDILIYVRPFYICILNN